MNHLHTSQPPSCTSVPGTREQPCTLEGLQLPPPAPQPWGWRKHPALRLLPAAIPEAGEDPAARGALALRPWWGSTQPPPTLKGRKPPQPPSSPPPQGKGCSPSSGCPDPPQPPTPGRGGGGGRAAAPSWGAPALSLGDTPGSERRNPPHPPHPEGAAPPASAGPRAAPLPSRRGPGGRGPCRAGGGRGPPLLLLRLLPGLGGGQRDGVGGVLQQRRGPRGRPAVAAPGAGRRHFGRGARSTYHLPRRQP